MKNKKLYFSTMAMILVYFLGGCAFITIDLQSLMRIPTMQERVLAKGEDGKVLVVEVLGLITNTRVRGMFVSQEGTLERVDDILNIAKNDPKIKAVILRVDSPGGSVTASDLLYRRITDFKTQMKVPVVTCITNIGASGGYMVSLAGDRIVALPTSMVGNIGVLMPSVSYQGLMDMLGVRNQTITSGKYKDAGTPMRDMTEDDKAIYKAVVDDMYADFIDKIKKRRPDMTEDDLKIAGDGRIMTANFAKQHHMIDEVGYYEDAIKSLCKLSGLANPTIVVYRRAGENEGGFYSWP
jgi:protease-4